jgi:hypothetical protein
LRATIAYYSGIDNAPEPEMITAAAASILETCIKQAAIKASQIAARHGVYVNETQVLLIVDTEPESETAKAFQTLFIAALRGAEMAVQ